MSTNTLETCTKDGTCTIDINQNQNQNQNQYNNKNNDRAVAFWGEDPNVIFQSAHIMEFFPTESMTYNQKLNAVSRLIIIITIVAFIIKPSMRMVVIAVITLFAIYLIHSNHAQERDKQARKSAATQAIVNEGFTGNPAMDYLVQSGKSINSGVFDQPTAQNPMSNVLVPDYEFNVNKKPAPPAFVESVNNNILNSAKQFIQDANPGQRDIADKLFKDLNEELSFEQSMRQFVSNPNTTIPNDQGAFAEFCYGSMISCKEGNQFACARNTSHYTNY